MFERNMPRDGSRLSIQKSKRSALSRDKHACLGTHPMPSRGLLFHKNNPPTRVGMLAWVTPTSIVVTIEFKAASAASVGVGFSLRRATSLASVSSTFHLDAFIACTCDTSSRIFRDHVVQ